MSNRTLIFLTVVTFLGMLALMFINAIPMLFAPNTEKYLKYNFVKGAAVEKDGKLYTLNFDEQNDLINLLNRSKPIKNDDVLVNTQMDVSRIIIYLFDSPDIIIKPIGYDDHNGLIFESLRFNKDGLVKDESLGKLKTLLEKSSSEK